MPRPKAPPRRGSAWFRHSRLSSTTFCVVQVDDPYGDYAHIYIRLSPGRCYVIDTGCGVGDLKAYLDEHCNTEGLPYTIICTHQHFDHVSGCYQFPGAEICFSAEDPAFSKTSIGQPMVNFKGEHLGDTQPFVITRWLQDGDLLPLDGAQQPRPDSSLRVLHTAGHTADGMSLFDPLERRLFSGDALYPAKDFETFQDLYPQYPPGGLFALPPGSSMRAYRATLAKIQAFVHQEQQEGSEIVLACGHNEPCLPAASFIAACVELFKLIEAGQLEPEQRFMGCMNNSPLWEFINPGDPRATLLVPQGFVGIA